MKVLLSVLLGLGAIGLGLVLLGPSATYEPPSFGDDYWGPGEPPAQEDTAVRPFKVKFDKEMVADLRRRLENTRRLQPALEDVGWTYGVRADFVAKVVDHWLNKYDFEARERHLNRYPQFVTRIQGLDIHFIHVKPTLPKNRKIQVLPLLILHGWPGSVVEFHKVIPLLTTPRADRDFVFELIAPSMPGFGYSDAAAKPGLGSIKIAHLMRNFMHRLGFEKFYTQGGDWGAIVTSYMAAMFPQTVLGMHSNMCLDFETKTLARILGYSLMPSLLPEDERSYLYPLEEQLSWLLEETGYFHEQATKPDTIGAGISDSPAGLAAYLLEKFSTGTSRQNKYRDDGNLFESFSADELIDNIMFYWVPNKATSAVRLYAESFNRHSVMHYRMDRIPIKVPSACAIFPNEFVRYPVDFLRERFVNLVHASKPDKGGHFAALEVPEILADDVFVAVDKMRQQHAQREKKRQ